MINYTERLTLLMQDVVSRVPALSFIDMADVLVFARSGRSNAEGAFATCHCLSLPPREPGSYFWRCRSTWGGPSAEGAFAPCHCLSLPPSEPGYYFWRDRSTRALTRRSEWFVT